MRFYARVKPKQLKPLAHSHLALRIFEISLDSRKMVLDFNENATFEDNTGYYNFPGVQFTTDILDEGPVIMKTLVIQVIEKYSEYIKKTKEFIKKERILGESQVKLREIFEKART